MPIEDPYFRNWHEGITVRQMCDETGGAPLYEKLYSPFSDWVHGGVAGIARALSIEENQIKWMPPLPSSYAGSMGVSFQCLLEAALNLDSHLNIGFGGRLEDLRSRFVDTFSRKQK
ncbi:MAG: hypothetical protein HYX86_05955 [Chloroflexi bacterium]|nr:hypothetical protein [Chloroflexota bacterium]